MSNDAKPRGLAGFRLLGRSGLRVSPICLGTGTFGQAWGPGWSTEEKTARRIFDDYVAAGGNFVDTANGYQAGESERWLGRFVKESGQRDRLVVATKFTFGTREGDPNGGGNGRKHIIEACEASLQRLGLDHIDLYWMHFWDRLTPVEEVLATLDRLVASGKIRYWGFSNVPAWYLGKAQTLADARGLERCAALQIEYSLITREIEHEFVPAARELGFALCPWSPLANGLLTGKYKKTESGGIAGEGRLGAGGFATGVNSDLRARNERIIEAVLSAAKELGRTPAQVAINWVTARPTVASTTIGATKPEQLADNLRALDFEIPSALLAKLDAASAPAVGAPYGFFTDEMHGMATGGTRVEKVV